MSLKWEYQDIIEVFLVWMHSTFLEIDGSYGFILFLPSKRVVDLC